MRGIIREWFLYLLSLYVLDYVFSFIFIANRSVLIAAGTSLFLLNTIGRPILKILWLPINIVTLGLFSWVINIVVILIVIYLVPGFRITALDTQAIQIGRLFVPAINLRLQWTYIAFTFILAWTISLLRWLLIED